MNWLKNCWYQAGWSEEIPAGGHLVRTLLGEPVLLLRDDVGKVSAVLDKCPHRFAPLSAGQISNGRATCGYHGLAFDGSGACVHNPHGPVTSAMKVRAFPVLERHDALWIWMGDPDKADAAALPDLGFIDATPAPARIAGLMPTAANYLLLSDNILDLSHADYLHPTTLGGMMTTAQSRSAVVGDTVEAEWISKDCVPPGAFVAAVPPGARADICIRVTWHAPALMVLQTIVTESGVAPEPKDESLTLHNMVPQTDGTTHYFFCSTRKFLLDDVQYSAFLREALRQAFETEDKPMLEKQQQRLGEADVFDLDPILLSTDAPAVRARRMLAQLVQAETASA